MKIILQENLEKLGTRGQVVDVADGYARNYLLPRKFALAATAGNLKQIERIRARLSKIEAQEHSQAQEAAGAISNAVVTLTRKVGQNDQLFGSVTTADIAEALAAQGLVVDKRKIALEEPLKQLGEFQVTVKLHHNVAATVNVVVAREGGAPPEPVSEAAPETESESASETESAPKTESATPPVE
ncbi:MAG TPA: 50S ribosomal protein L9 [Candidatus Dormibacteraeota bacterium]|nr:50S ribosomal protein L9 [Candidatus Dormibacteraeota bacterium]